MRYVLIALTALSLSAAFSFASAQQTPDFEPLYVGMPNHDTFIAACLDEASARQVLAEQKVNGAAAARKVFAATGMCFQMRADFIAIRVVGEVDMGTHVVRIIEVGSIRDTSAQHLFIITEAPLLEGITA
ncbi:MAG: hypothetical protein AAF563_08960 [Pseudomonadota bacterium]